MVGSVNRCPTHAGLAMLTATTCGSTVAMFRARLKAATPEQQQASEAKQRVREGVHLALFALLQLKHSWNSSCALFIDVYRLISQLGSSIDSQILPTGAAMLPLGAAAQPGAHQPGLGQRLAIRAGDLARIWPDGKVKWLRLRLLRHVV